MTCGWTVLQIAKQLRQATNWCHSAVCLLVLRDGRSDGVAQVGWEADPTVQDSKPRQEKSDRVRF